MTPNIGCNGPSRSTALTGTVEDPSLLSSSSSSPGCNFLQYCQVFVARNLRFFDGGPGNSVALVMSKSSNNELWSSDISEDVSVVSLVTIWGVSKVILDR